MEDLLKRWVPIIGSISFITTVLSLIIFIWVDNHIIFKTGMTSLVIFLVCLLADKSFKNN